MFITGWDTHKLYRSVHISQTDSGDGVLVEGRKSTGERSVWGDSMSDGMK